MTNCGAPRAFSTPKDCAMPNDMYNEMSTVSHLGGSPGCVCKLSRAVDVSLPLCAVG